ncbi:MAG: hypothetical protein ACOC3T_01075 [Bacteroidota bacterium]
MITAHGFMMRRLGGFIRLTDLQINSVIGCHIFIGITNLLINIDYNEDSIVAFAGANNTCEVLVGFPTDGKGLYLLNDKVELTPKRYVDNHVVNYYQTTVWFINFG